MYSTTRSEDYQHMFSRRVGYALLVIVSPALALSTPLPSWIIFFVTPILLLLLLPLLLVFTTMVSRQVNEKEKDYGSYCFKILNIDESEEGLTDFCGTHAD